MLGYALILMLNGNEKDKFFHIPLRQRPKPSLAWFRVCAHGAVYRRRCRVLIHCAVRFVERDECAAIGFSFVFILK